MTLSPSLVRNYEQLKPPYNKNKQHWIQYDNEPHKLALIIYIEGTYFTKFCRNSQNLLTFFILCNAKYK